MYSIKSCKLAFIRPNASISSKSRVCLAPSIISIIVLLLRTLLTWGIRVLIFLELLKDGFFKLGVVYQKPIWLRRKLSQDRFHIVPTELLLVEKLENVLKFLVGDKTVFLFVNSSDGLLYLKHLVILNKCPHHNIYIMQRCKLLR